ncbi:MAG: DUF4412 domain-containing protein [Bacteroidales bacterium]|nr:DUF4412 domain-containing protein [Bacteroidales bacterium]
MILLRPTIIYFIFLFLCFSAYTQPRVNPQQPEVNKPVFEGSIKCVQQSKVDTVYYTFYVKDKKVRVDEINNGIDNSLIFDLDKKTIVALSPQKKLYMNIPTTPYVDGENENFNIIKSNNSKIINGYKCYQWRVRNTEQNTEIAYWVAYDNFEFFEEFLKLWNKREKQFTFFLKIPDISGVFPMQQVERTLLRDERCRQEVVSVEKKEIKDDIFAIPKDFKNYDH